MTKPLRAVAIPEVLIVLLPLCLIFTHDSNALDPALNPRLMVLSLFLMPIMLFLWRRPQFRASLGSLPSILWALFILIESISWLLHGCGLEGLILLFKDFTFYLLMLAVGSMNWKHLNIEILSWSALLGILLIMGFVIFEDLDGSFFNPFGDFPFTDLKGRMAHHNLLASALALLIPLSLLSPKARIRYPALLVFVSNLILIYGTRSRSAQLAVLAAGGLFVLLHLLRAKISRWRLPKKTIPIVLALVLLPLLLVQYRYLLSKTGEGKALQSNLLETHGNDKSFSTGERLKMWDYTIAMIQDHGLLGLGPGEWSREFPLYGSEVYRARQGIVQFQRPHNDYLWIWAESGVFALLCYLGFIISIFALGFKGMGKERSSFSPLLLGGITVFLVVSMFSFPRERIFHQSLLFILAGLLLSSNNLRHQKTLSTGPGLLFGLLAMALLGTSAFAAYERWKGERITRSMIVAHGSANWQKLLALKQKTDDLTFYQISPVGMPMEFYSGLAYLNLKKLDLAKREYRIAYQLHPNNLQVCNNLANTYTLLNNVDSALVHYQKAIEISPFYKEGILNLASSFYNHGETEKAYALLREKAAEFDLDKTLYEQYLITIIRAWAGDKSIDLNPISNERLLKLHYILAYDIPEQEFWPFIMEELKQIKKANAMAQ
ncbi:MAG: O-antigen ligase family protein [Bacteroidetes bacterium]|nr:O-antigen ligase family protein [Bacteroidota bacterium]